ncbi:hypothetical protein ECG_02031 [Echinococcus granulosus]|nr:hypothetical protein ECG_02031 [Echinococcus granulosus]
MCSRFPVIVSTSLSTSASALAETAATTAVAVTATEMALKLRIATVVVETTTHQPLIEVLHRHLPQTSILLQEGRSEALMKKQIRPPCKSTYRGGN